MHMMAGLHDAVLDPREWPVVLRSLVETLGVAGAAYFVRDNRSGAIEWASFFGPTTGFKSEYLTHFSSLDPFANLLAQGAPGWTRLTQSLPAPMLRHDEWYNDFVMMSGIGDVVGARLASVGSHTAFFGIHEGIGQNQIGPSGGPPLDRVLARLSKAADVQLRLQSLGWSSAVAGHALDQLSTGVIVAEGSGRVVEMNGLAEQILRRGDGLAVENGKLRALRVFEAARLSASIAAATANQVGVSTSSRILIGRRAGRRSYILTVTPLDVRFGFHDDPVALILVVDPDERSPKANELAEYFGLSPAESRLAAHLVSGKRLAGISSTTGLAVSTLRTQLRSVLKKVGVERQADLLRVLASLPSSPTQGPAPE